MVMNKITIELPPPDPKLHAHAKGHWRSKTAATKQLRELAFMLVKQQHRGATWDRAVVDYAFHFKDNRRRDAANAIQSMKPAIDGAVGAGLLVDDCWRHLMIGAVTCDVDRDNPRTVITFHRTA